MSRRVLIFGLLAATLAACGEPPGLHFVSPDSGTAVSGRVEVVLQTAEPAVSGQVASYEVVSDTAIDVVITVQRSDPSRPATCRLLAQSTDFQPVAEQDVVIEAGTAKVADKPVTLKTLRRATSATVRSCTSG